MATIIEEFYPVSISNVAIKFKKEAIATSFGCVGTLEGETEISEIKATCGRATKKKKTKPKEMTGKVTGFVKIEVLRRLFGLSNEGLRPGVYAYGEDSSSEEFTLTADIIDDFDDVVKLAAFPKSIVTTGFKFTVDTSADEVANLEIDFTAMPDENGKFYYESFLDEIDEETAKKWRENFTYDLVKEKTP